MHDTLSMIGIGAAAFAAGLVNAIAGGGSLLTFPTLVAIGLPSVEASLTNTVALCPGYLGAMLAQHQDLAGQGARMVRLLPVAAIGGVTGALLLLGLTDERAFELVVPFLILFAAVLLATQEPLQRFVQSRTQARAGDAGSRSEAWAVLPVGLAAVYGGYFGAGMGVMVLAILAVVLVDSLRRVNALKQCVSLVVNVAAACVFLASGRIDWPIAGVMLACSLGGGALGGRISTKIPAAALRWTVVVVAVALATVYFVRW